MPKAEASKPREKGDRTPTISIDVYNALYEAFCERQTVRHCARVCQVSQQTATRYIEKGDPSRHLRAIRARWEQVQRNAQQAEDYSLVKARRDVQTAARAFLMRIAAKIQKMQPDDLDANGIGRQLEVTQRVIERTLGVADATFEVRGQDKWAGWTVDEMLLFAETGERPAHATGPSGIKAHSADK